MKRFGKIVIYFGIVAGLFLFFLPKINLYYQAEAFLKTYKVIVSQEKVTDQGLGLRISDAKLYYDDLLVAKIEEIKIRTLIFYNSVSIAPFSLSKDMEQFLPLGIENLNITHSVLSPLHVKIEGEGDFGVLDGDISVYDKNISLVLTPSTLLEKKKPFWLKRMKKTAEGEYRYESAY
jgi:hypothetical protein